MPTKQTKAQLEADLMAAREKIHKLETKLERHTQKENSSRDGMNENRHNIFIIADLSQKIISISNSAEKLFGYTANELFGKSLHILLPEMGKKPNRNIPIKSSKQTSKANQSNASIISGQRKDGSSFIANFELVQCRQEAGNINIIFLTDIHHEKALRPWVENEQIFSEVMENIHEVLYLTDIRNRKILYISPAYEKIWGRTVESVYQDMHSFVEAIDEMYRKDVFTALDRQSRGEATLIEYCITRPDGSKRWIRDRGFPVFNEDGIFVRVTGIAEDITEYKKAFLALKASELNYRTLVEHTDNAIAILDEKGVILFANTKGIQIWNDPQIIGKTIFEIFPEAYAQRYHQAINDVIKQRKGIIDEIQGPIHGNLKWFRVSMQPIQNDEGYIDRLLLSAWDTTEERLEHEKLIQSDLRFRGYFEQPNIGIVIISKDMKWVEVNNSMANMLGYSREEFLELEWYVLTHPDEKEETLNSFLQIIQGTTDKFSLEKRCLTKEKKIIYINLDVRAVYKPDGELDYLFATAQNITERIEANEQSKFQAFILDKVEQAVIVTNERGIISYWNSFAEQLYDYESNEVIGRPITDITVADQTMEEAYQIMGRLKRGQSWSGDFLVRTKHGKTFHAAVTDTPILDENGNLTTIIGVSSDITQRKEYEKQTVYQASLLQNISDAIIATDENFRITEWNKAAERMYGWTLEEVKGSIVMDVLKTEYIDETQEIAYKKIDENGHLISKVIHKHKDGHSLHVNSSVTALADKNGVRYGVIAVNRDESERNKAEEALRQSEEKFHHLFDTMAQGVVYYNPQGEITLANSAAEDILGINYKQMQDSFSIHSLLKTVHEDGSDFPEEESPYRQAFKTGKPVYNVLMGIYHQKKQHYRWIIMNAIPEFVHGEDRPYQVYATITDITDHKDAEKLLEEKVRSRTEEIETVQKRLELATNAVGLGIWEFTPANGNLIWDKKMYEIYGYEPGQFQLGFENFISIVHPNDVDILTKNLQDLLNGRNPETTIYRIIQPNNEIRYIKAHGMAIYDDNKNLITIVGTALDVTNETTAEQTLRESEAQNRLLFEESPDPAVLLDDLGKYARINHAYEVLSGYSREEIIGKSPFEINAIGEGIATEWAASWQELFNEPDNYISFEFDHMRRDGITQVVEARLYPVTLNNKKHVLCNLRDVTERRQAQQRLESLTQRLELATKSAKIGIWEWNIKQDKLIWDKQSFELFGVSPKENLDTFNRWAACVHPDDLATQLELIEQTKQQGSEFNTEYRVIWPDQTIHYINSNAITVHDKKGDLERMVGTNIDVTLRKQAELLLKRREETLSNANLKLEQAIRMKDEFLASMSHELRTPLTGILGLSEAMQYMVYGSLNEKQLNALSNIQSSGKHLLELINDILDISKIEASQLELTSQMTSIYEICQACVHIVRIMAQKKKQVMEVEIDRSAQSAYINVDVRRIKQILVNLLTNAIKFTPEGGKLGLKVSANEEKQMVSIQIWDEGIGISHENQSRLFKPFVQLDSSLSRQYTGTGLGLVLAKRLTELHGGTIELQSEIGHGSTFIITLPWQPNLLATSTEKQLSNIQPEMPSVTYHTSTKQNSNPPLILIVEDNPTNIDTIEDFLKANEFRVNTAKSGIECLQLLPQIRPDLILMDIQMPSLDGLETTRRIRNYPDPQISIIPIIALTALAMPGDHERCIAAGTNDYLSKPYRLVELIEKIKSHLKSM